MVAIKVKNKEGKKFIMFSSEEREKFFNEFTLMENDGYSRKEVWDQLKYDEQRGPDGVELMTSAQFHSIWSSYEKWLTVEAEECEEEEELEEVIDEEWCRSILASDMSDKLKIANLKYAYGIEGES